MKPTRHLTLSAPVHLIRPAATFSPADAEKAMEAEREYDPAESG
jgi:hypothetical protein